MVFPKFVNLPFTWFKQYCEYRTVSDYKILKLVLIGDSGVGKTALMFRYLNNEYRDTLVSISIDFVSIELTLNKWTS